MAAIQVATSVRTYANMANMCEKGYDLFLIMIICECIGSKGLRASDTLEALLPMIKEVASRKQRGAH